MALTTSIEGLSLANYNFSFSLYKEVAKTESGNIFYSPLSIHVIMFMVSIGAASKTFDEIIATINVNKNNYSLEAYKMYLDNITSEHAFIKLVNGMFVDNVFNVKDSFVNSTMIYLNSSMEKLNFKNDPEPQRQYINDWILNKTNNKINNLFPSGSISIDTALVLANAVHFKSSWKNKFDGTEDDYFYETPTNKVSIKMMKLKNRLHYYYDNVLQFAALELPYEHHAFKMMILLPDAKDGLKNLEDNFSKINLHDISNQMKSYGVNVKLPRFKLESSLDLKKKFSDLGCSTMFTRAANFSNIAVENLYVTAFVHKAYVAVNENGTEAAAATGMSIGVRSGREYKNVVVDHPFIFFIMSKSGSIIFVGRMTKIDSPA